MMFSGDQMSMGLYYAKDISDLLDIGWNILLSDPEKYQEI
jgi:hypothetical protein